MLCMCTPHPASLHHALQLKTEVTRLAAERQRLCDLRLQLATETGLLEREKAAWEARKVRLQA